MGLSVDREVHCEVLLWSLPTNRGTSTTSTVELVQLRIREHYNLALDFGHQEGL